MPLELVAARDEMGLAMSTGRLINIAALVIVAVGVGLVGGPAAERNLARRATRRISPGRSPYRTVGSLAVWVACA